MNVFDQDNVVKNRLLMALIGALAGIAIWFLIDPLPDMIENTRLVVCLAAFTGGFFTVLLATLGPLRFTQAARAACAVAIVSAGLLAWASFRFDHIDDFVETGFSLVAFGLLVWLPVPFVLASLISDQGWRDYSVVFDHAWQIFVRYLVALTFTGLFWGIIGLSNLVLQIAGLEIIETLLKVDPVPFIVTGLGLGLGLAVVHEMRAYISPFLALRLLRLMLPLVLVVSVVFLIAAPFQGLSNLFGGLSAAGVLMALALVAATLITAVVDASKAEAARSSILLYAARAMSLVLPVLGALAVWAIWVRVVQYGWTPTRVAAAIMGFLVLAYGVAYGAAILSGANWPARIRRANTTLALVLIGLCALWLTPVLNPEQMSVNSQIARFESGKTDVAVLDLWQLDRTWGRAGQAAMARLRVIEIPDRAALDERISRLDTANSQFDLRHESTEAQRAQLRTLLAVRPAGAMLPQDAFSGDFRVSNWLAGCRGSTPAGNPGCVALVSDFEPAAVGDEVVLFYLDREGALGSQYWSGPTGTGFMQSLGPAWGDPKIIDAILNGATKISRAPQDILLIGEYQIEIEE